MAAGDKDEYGSLPSWNIVVICTVGGILFFEHICHEVRERRRNRLTTDCSADHEQQDWQLYPIDSQSAESYDHSIFEYLKKIVL